MIMRRRTPRFGTATGTVAQFTASGFDRYLRILAPFETVGEANAVSWAQRAEDCGVDLEPGTSCWDLGLPRSSRGESALIPAYGYWPSASLGLLICALASESSFEEPCVWITWRGYAKDMAAQTDRAMPTSLDLGNWISPSTAFELHEPLSWLADQSRERGKHVPLAGWPKSLAWVLAAPADHDSLYLSCDRQTEHHLSSLLETLPVTFRDPVTNGY